jgi:CheY-like chemotaxis protein
MSILENKRILIVDDESMLREILRDVLEYEGARVQEAENGKAAME